MFDEKPIETLMATAVLGLKFTGVGAIIGNKIWSKIKKSLYNSSAAKSMANMAATGFSTTLATAIKKALGSAATLGIIAAGVAMITKGVKDMLSDPDAFKNEDVENYKSENPGSMAEGAETPQIEVPVVAVDNTEPGISAAKLNMEENLPSETSVDIQAKDEVTDKVALVKEALIKIPQNLGIQIDANTNAAQLALLGLETVTKGVATVFYQTEKDTAQSAEGIDSSVGGISGILNGLADSSLMTQLKFLLLVAALTSLKDSGKLTNDQFNNLKTSIDQAGDSESGFKVATDNISGYLEDAGISAEEFGVSLVSGFQNSSKEFGSAAEDVRKVLSDIAETMKTGGNTAGKNYTDGLSGGLSDGSETVNSSVKAVTDGMKETTEVELESNSPSRVGERYGKYYDEGIALGVSENISYIKKAIKELVDSMKLPLDDFSSGIQSTGKTLMRRLSSGITSGTPDATNAMKKAGNQLSRTISGMSNSLYRAGKNLMTSFRNGMTSVHIPTPHISMTFGVSISDGTISTFSRNSVSWYKTGGLFTKATIAGLGEAGKEAVLPLENRRTMNMIADSIMKNASVGVDEETLTNAVARGVAMAMMNNQGNQTPINLYATLYTEDNEVLARAVAKGQESIDYRYNPTPQFG